MACSATYMIAEPDELLSGSSVNDLELGMTPVDSGGGGMKKNYERPAVIHTEKLEARAVSCNKADDSCNSGGAIQS